MISSNMKLTIIQVSVRVNLTFCNTGWSDSLVTCKELTVHINTGMYNKKVSDKSIKNHPDMWILQGNTFNL